MAEKLDSYDFQRRNRDLPSPWDTWLNGEVWRLKHGDDFRATPLSFRTMAYAAAKERGCRVHVAAETDDSLVIQAYDLNGDSK